MLTSRTMGAALWLAAGVVAFLLARIVPLRRTRRWATELVIVLVAAFLSGVLATALDFGGWNEPDWRAGLFTLFVAAAAAGTLRAVRK